MRDDSRLLKPILEVIEDAYSERVVLESSDQDIPGEWVLYAAEFEAASTPGNPLEPGRR